jgi:hypothetical protein
MRITDLRQGRSADEGDLCLTLRGAQALLNELRGIVPEAQTDSSEAEIVLTSRDVRVDLSGDEINQLAGALVAVLTNPKESHEHVSGSDYTRELTVWIDDQLGSADATVRRVP